MSSHGLPYHIALLTTLIQNNHGWANGRQGAPDQEALLRSNELFAKADRVLGMLHRVDHRATRSFNHSRETLHRFIAFSTVLSLSPSSLFKMRGKVLPCAIHFQLLPHLVWGGLHPCPEVGE